METIRIFDTTLRDGEQSPGATMTLAEKLQIAHYFEAMGVDVIEAGFPASSPKDFEAVRVIASEIENSVVCGLARSLPPDIERAGAAIKHATHGRIHVFCATSKIHREHKLHKRAEEIIRLSVRSVRQAREYTSDVEFSAEDAGRTEPAFLAEIVQAAVEAGATTINLPDTVGYTAPREYGRIFSGLIEQLPILRERGIILSAHCHNDLGLAVANSLSALDHGARQIECTINGIGERAGNAPLEEIVMNLHTRPDLHPFITRVDTTKLYGASKMVSDLTGLVIARNKPIVGENAFAHEAGIHQDGVLKHARTYEIMDPATIGAPPGSMVMGKHSGKHAFLECATKLGYSLDEAELRQVFEQFKDLADRQKRVSDQEIKNLIEGVINHAVKIVCAPIY